MIFCHTVSLCCTKKHLIRMAQERLRVERNETPFEKTP